MNRQLSKYHLACPDCKFYDTNILSPPCNTCNMVEINNHLATFNFKHKEEKNENKPSP